jgi:hypothetical protein
MESAKTLRAMEFFMKTMNFYGELKFHGFKSNSVEGRNQLAVREQWFSTCFAVNQDVGNLLLFH